LQQSSLTVGPLSPSLASTHTYRSYPQDDFVTMAVIYFRMAKKHTNIPLAAVCTGVCEKVWRKVVFSSFNSSKPQTWSDCTRKNYQTTEMVVISS